MVDLRSTVVTKSDQLNAEDLVGGPITVKITGVDVKVGAEQVWSIHYEGDKGKPWKPCKGMIRLLIQEWGHESEDYIGRWVKLFRDPTVRFGKETTGGIRVSGLSHIDKTRQIVVKKAKFAFDRYQIEKIEPPKPKKVEPKSDTPFEKKQSPAERISAWIDELESLLPDEFQTEMVKDDFRTKRDYVIDKLGDESIRQRLENLIKVKTNG